MVSSIVLIIAGFILLIKGADVLIEGGGSIAKHLSIPEIVIGLTIISIGTSAPELVVNIIASLSGNSEIAIGNVFGSNIANIFLVIGIAGVIAPITVGRTTSMIEIPFGIFVTLLLGVLLNDTFFRQSENAALTPFDGIILLSFFIVFLGYVYYAAQKKEEVELEHVRVLSIPKSIVFIVIGAAGLAVGGKLVVSGAVGIASSFGVSQAMIGLTIVALGTSLPELFASVVATMKNKHALAIGNVVGSNIFNILLILGVSSTISEIHYPLFMNTDYLFVLLAITALFVVVSGSSRGRITRTDAIIFLNMYIGYMIFIILRR